MSQLHHEAAACALEWGRRPSVSPTPEEEESRQAGRAGGRQTTGPFVTAAHLGQVAVHVPSAQLVLLGAVLQSVFVQQTPPVQPTWHAARTPFPCVQ